MKGSERFQAAMTEAMKNHLLPSWENDAKELGEILRNEIFNLKGPRVVSRSPSPKDRFVGKVFRGFLEIQKCTDALEDIALYAARFPHRNTRVTPERYLQFCVEAYLTEVHILRERLVAYLKMVERQYKGEVGLTPVRAQCQSLLKGAVSSLEGVARVRAAHVHEHRFMDPDIDRLGTLALFARSGEDEFSMTMRTFFRVEYRSVRKKWRRTLITNNNAIKSLLDSFFDGLHALMFEEETGALRFPRGMIT